MQSRLHPYLNFPENTRDAMEFYLSVFGGKLQMMTFKDFNASQDPSEDDLIMHAELAGGNDITILASDAPARMEYRPGNNFSLSLVGDNEAELTNYFEKLSDGGTVTQPLVKAGWGDTFGMCIDPFGVNWICNISAPKA